MPERLSALRRDHANLQRRAAALFSAIDARNGADVRPQLNEFLAAVAAHLECSQHHTVDVLRQHASPGIRRVADRLHEERAEFTAYFDRFVAAWKRAPLESLLAMPMRHDLEQLVANLLKQIRVEDRLLTMLASVA